jgi:hypothetical protein
VSDVFREVDEEVRRDQFLKLWRRYGNYAIAGTAALVIAFGGYLGWKDYRVRQSEAEGAQFASALNELQAGKAADAAKAFADFAANAGAGYRAMALLQEAAARLRVKDVNGAIAAYDRLAADGGVDTLWRDLARLLAVMQRLDSAPIEELDRQLAPLVADSNPWRFTARELAATVRLKAGDKSGAREGFRRVADDAAAPAGARARAAEILAALGEGS